jgi:hypothetical protein
VSDNRTPEQRFWAKVDRAGPLPEYRPELGPCWLWTAGLNQAGYSVFWIDGRSIQGHIYAWRLENGIAPPGKELDHLCRSPSCVRPSHLEPVTHLENVRRGRKGVLAFFR